MRQGRTKTQPQIKDKPDVVPKERRKKLMEELKACNVHAMWKAVNELEDMASRPNTKKRLSAETLFIAIAAVHEMAERTRHKNVDNRRAAPANDLRIENCHVYEPGENVETVADNCEVLIKGADLQKLTAASENKPLTLEQLREMKGQPVYCIGQTRFDVHFDGWKVVAKKNLTANVIRFTDGMDFPVEVYGKRLLAYARKPEGSE